MDRRSFVKRTGIALFAGLPLAGTATPVLQTFTVREVAKLFEIPEKLLGGDGGFVVPKEYVAVITRHQVINDQKIHLRKRRRHMRD